MSRKKNEIPRKYTENQRIKGNAQMSQWVSKESIKEFETIMLDLKHYTLDNGSDAPTKGTVLSYLIIKGCQNFSKDEFFKSQTT